MLSGFPSSPQNVYIGRGWISWSDFLGYKNGVGWHFLSFNNAKKYMKNVGLKSIKEWEKFCKDKPDNIPLSPHKTYELSGWNGFPDFLGYEIC